MNPADELNRRIAQIAADNSSGASEILNDVVAILRDGRDAGLPLLPLARALVRAQPTMASVWNAAVSAMASRDAEDRLQRFADRAARAPAAIARVFADFIGPDAPHRRPGAPFRLVTLSFSGTLLTVLDTLRQTWALEVACSDSRPSLEGRRLAARLAASGIPVTLFTDAAIGHALRHTDAVVLGADAIGPEWVMNKSGTRPLASAAVHDGVPVYVLCGRDKFLSSALADRLVSREGEASEVWDAPPAGIAIRNPYFEATSLDLITAVISDIGALGAALVPAACEAVHDAAALRALAEL